MCTFRVESTHITGLLLEHVDLVQGLLEFTGLYDIPGSVGATTGGWSGPKYLGKAACRRKELVDLLGEVLLLLFGIGHDVCRIWGGGRKPSTRRGSETGLTRRVQALSILLLAFGHVEWRSHRHGRSEVEAQKLETRVRNVVCVLVLCCFFGQVGRRSFRRTLTRHGNAFRGTNNDIVIHSSRILRLVPARVVPHVSIQHKNHKSKNY